MARTQFEAAEISPYHDDSWFSVNEQDADVELSENMSLTRLRYISSRLIKNNFIVAGMTQAVLNGIVGEGITIRAKNGNKKLTKTMNKILDGVNRDRDRGIQSALELMINSAIEKGDVLVNMARDKRQVLSNVGMSTFMEIIESSRVKTPPKEKNNPNVREGVKYVNGYVDGYYVKKLNTDSRQTYRSDKDEDFTYLPRYKKGKKVCELFSLPYNRKPDQSRAYPIFTPIMNLLRYFNDYLETILIQARVSATFSAFIKSSNPAGNKAAMEKEMGSPLEAVAKLKAGMIWNMKNADSIEFASPNRPSDNTDQFIRRLTRLMCMPLRISYEGVFLDLSEVNYTSFKAGQIEARRQNAKSQRETIKMAEWLSSFFIDEAIAKKMIPKGTTTDDFYFSLPKLQVVDEEKKARADNLSLNKNQTISRQQICDDENRDFEQVIDDLLEEAIALADNEGKVLAYKKELSEKYGIIFPDTVQPEQVLSKDGKRDTSKSRRVGEKKGGDLDEEDALERRKEDNNMESDELEGDF